MTPSVRDRSGAAPARRSRLVDAALAVAGLAVMATLIHRLGAGVLLVHIRLVGWGMLLVVGQEIIAIGANTLGWRAAFPSRTRPRFATLLAARIAGDAVNYVTPTATLGGELVRARLVHDGTARLDVATSIAVAKVGQTIAQLAFIVVGVVVLVLAVPLATPVRLALGGGATLLCAAGVAVWAAQRRGMFGPLVRLASRLDRRGRLASIAGVVDRLDAEIARVHRAPERPFVVSVAWFFLGWTLGAVEIALMLWLLGVPVTFRAAIAVEALSAAVDALLFFVPGKLGTQEGGKVLIFTTVGLDPALGLAVGVLRRIRELSWSLLGLGLVARAEWTHAPEPIEAGVAES